MPAALSTTSFAVLGMLALRPWTPYELTQQMRRSLSWCWPMSERALYSEPERLVAAGLARVDVEPSGTRLRRTYSITGAGRAALGDWLREPAQPPRLQSEPLLRVLFADQGERGDLLGVLERLRADLADQWQRGRAQAVEYLDGEPPFPGRAHLVALFADLMDRVLEVTDAWAADAAEEVAGWSRTRDVGMTSGARDRLRRVAARD